MKSFLMNLQNSAYAAVSEFDDLLEFRQCESGVDIQIILLVQTGLHLIALSNKSGRKFHPFIALLTPVSIYLLTSCISPALIASILLGGFFTVVTKVFHFPYNLRFR